MGVRMDKMSAESLIICQHMINPVQERFVGQAKSSNCFYVYGFESINQFIIWAWPNRVTETACFDANV